MADIEETLTDGAERQTEDNQSQDEEGQVRNN